MKLSIKSRGAAIVGTLALVGGLAAWGGVAMAAIPDSPSGVFHVCVQTNRSVNSQYTMYVIDPAAQTNFNGGCNTGYTEYQLNQTGPAGAKGDKGDTGAAGPGVTYYTVRNNGMIDPENPGFVTATCNTGDKAVGGGGYLVNAVPGSYTGTYPAGEPQDGSAPTGWTGYFFNNHSGAGNAHNAYVWAVCAHS